MKRARSVSKSAESVSSKDEPPKKVSKKRVKPIAQSQCQSTDTSTVVSTPTSLVKPGVPLHSVPKLGSLPMYGEHLPEDGYVSIPTHAETTCDNLRVVMANIRDCKLKGGSKVCQFSVVQR